MKLDKFKTYSYVSTVVGLFLFSLVFLTAPLIIPPIIAGLLSTLAFVGASNYKKLSKFKNYRFYELRLESSGAQGGFNFYLLQKADDVKSGNHKFVFSEKELSPNMRDFLHMQRRYEYVQSVQITPKEMSVLHAKTQQNRKKIEEMF